MIIGNKNFKLGEKTYIMGILNITPDSFSDGGKFNSKDEALKQVEKLIKEGADIIDVGGESTRPNHIPVSEEEEARRVVPIIKIIKENFDIPITIDTYKGSVAEAAIKAGADLINDVWGFKKDPYMKEVAAKYNVPCCLMHNRFNSEYSKDLIEEIKSDLKESIELALEAGVKKENIILDPGIGFVKTYEENLETMDRLEELMDLGYPMLLGTSRKSMIGTALNLPVDQRVEGTVATTAIGIVNGCDFIRVHDVKENSRVAKMTDALVRRK